MNWRDQFNNDPILSKLGTAELWVSRTSGNLGANAATTVYELVANGSANETAIYAGGARGVHQTSASGVAVVLAAIAVGSEGTTVGSWGYNAYRVVIRLKTSCELQTQFSSCSFDTRDFYLMGGLDATTMLQDEVGQPCVPCLGYVKDGDNVATATEGSGGTGTTPNVETFAQRRTSADTAINDILLTENYRQSPYNQGNRDSARFREQEGMSGIITEMGRDATTSACNGMYRVYHLLHNVPRFNNPSGVFDNDQYHYKVYVKCATSAVITSLDADWVALAIDAGVHKLDGSGIITSAADLVEKGGNI